MSQAATRPRWDIFCTVIDNYGDIGVCWRLARQLAVEQNYQIRLWVDDLLAFNRLCPEVDIALNSQTQQGVEIHAWQTPFPALPDDALPDVVVEAFACTLPQNYIVALAARAPKPRWINLEYLSAEAWVAECHGLPSPHPQLPLLKHFFIPGFDKHSAGLLREGDLLAHHAAFDVERWWGSYGGKASDEQLSVSLFAYENASVKELLTGWSSNKQAMCCMVTDSRIVSSVETALNRPLLSDQVIVLGSLNLHTLPFMRQEAYDDLLAACDINFVRGEDSLVRAIWAGKPFIWHIYPQSDAAHLIKLDAFLDRYCAGLSSPANHTLRNFWYGWNAETATVADWDAYIKHLPEIALHTLYWRENLAQLPDLATTLAEFCRNPL